MTEDFAAARAENVDEFADDEFDDNLAQDDLDQGEPDGELDGEVGDEFTDEVSVAPTGDVDPAVQARLADIAAAPLSEHAEAYQQIHTELQQALADIDAS